MVFAALSDAIMIVKRFTVLCLALIATLLKGGDCQTQEQCELVRVGIAPVLAPCRTSVDACINAPEVNFPTFASTFCPRQARNSFDSFLICEGRGFTDQIFGGICGGPSCAGPDQTFSECAPEEGQRCYNEAVVENNNGTAAFEACLCSNSSQNSTNPECSAECARELEQLVEDVGCCVNTAVYSFYFSTCGDSPDEGNNFQLNVDVLNSLFDACGVDLPATCLHTFSGRGTSAASMVTTAGASAVFVCLMLVVYFLF